MSDHALQTKKRTSQFGHCPCVHNKLKPSSESQMSMYSVQMGSGSMSTPTFRPNCKENGLSLWWVPRKSLKITAIKLGSYRLCQGAGPLRVVKDFIVED